MPIYNGGVQIPADWKVKRMDKPDSSDFLVVRENGYIKIPKDSYLVYLPLFYALPKELAGKRPAYLDLPRNINRLLREDRYRDMVNCDSFLELVWDCYAWAIWQFLQVPAKDGGYRDIPGDWSHYSGDFPLWRLCYGIIQHFRYAFEYEMDWSFQRLFAAPEDIGFPWLTYQQFSNLVGNLTDKIVAEQNYQPMIDAIWKNRQPEDYNRGQNTNKRDFLRSWNHDRKYEQLSVEGITEAGAVVDGESFYDIPDPTAEFEAKVISEAQVQHFQQSLSEQDMKILQMRMQGKTLQEIADAVGLKTAGAVKKRIDKMAGAYEAFVTDQHGE